MRVATCGRLFSCEPPYCFVISSDDVIHNIYSFGRVAQLNQQDAVSANCFVHGSVQAVFEEKDPIGTPLMVVSPHGKRQMGLAEKPRSEVVFGTRIEYSWTSFRSTLPTTCRLLRRPGFMECWSIQTRSMRRKWCPPNWTQISREAITLAAFNTKTLQIDSRQDRLIHVATSSGTSHSPTSKQTEPHSQLNGMLIGVIPLGNVTV